MVKKNFFECFLIVNNWKSKIKSFYEGFRKIWKFFKLISRFQNAIIPWGIQFLNWNCLRNVQHDQINQPTLLFGFKFFFCFSTQKVVFIRKNVAFFNDSDKMAFWSLEKHFHTGTWLPSEKYYDELHFYFFGKNFGRDLKCPSTFASKEQL